MDSVAKEFLFKEYDALRSEITLHLNYLIRTVAAGVLVLPSVLGLAINFKSDILVISLPMAVTIFLLLLWYHQSTIMVIGRYIRYFIEPQLMKSTPDMDGYEDFLEIYKGGRAPEKLFAAIACIIFIIYFVAAEYFSYLWLQKDFSNAALYILGAFAFLFAIVFIAFLGIFPRGTGHLRRRPNKRRAVDSMQIIVDERSGDISRKTVN